MNERYKNYLALKGVIANAQYNIKGDAIVKVATLLNWFEKLEPEFKEKKEIEIKELRKNVDK